MEVVGFCTDNDYMGVVEYDNEDMFFNNVVELYVYVVVYIALISIKGKNLMLHGYMDYSKNKRRGEKPRF